MGKRILTGLKPTSDQIHLGNYFGAVKPLFDLVSSDKDHKAFLMIANMHALTTLHDPVALRQNTLSFIKLYVALIQSYGLDIDRFVIYNPAYIPAHAQLAHILGCITHMGFMERMHAYKDAVAKGKSGEVGVGTFCYPILQAADIVLYDADIVPVGQDQKQHVEFCRDIAVRFNKVFGDTLCIPDVHIEKSVATLPGIDGRKMSKSYNNYLGLLDDEKTLTKKIRQIATASLAIEDTKDPTTCNVYAILQHFLSENERVYRIKRYTDGGMSFAEVKQELVEKVIAFASTVQQKYAHLTDDEIIIIIDRGTKQAYDIATKKITEINQKVGFGL